MQITFVLALVFAIAVAIFAVQNTSPVAVSFLWLQIPQVAVSVLVLICTLVGAVLVLLVGVGREVKRSLALRALRSQLQRQERLGEELREQIKSSGTPAPTSPPASAAGSTAVASSFEVPPSAPRPASAEPGSTV